MSSRALSVRALCATVLIASASAQGLVGYAGIPASPTTSLIQQNIIPCNTVATLCATTLPAVALTQAHEGAFAYDPIRSGVGYVSDGTTIVRQALTGTCATSCSIPAAFAFSSAATRVGGMAVDVRRAQLAHAESIPGMGAIRLYSIATSTTCPVPAAACTFPLPWPTGRIGGLAYDGRRDVFYVAASNLTPLDHRILVIPRTPFPSCTTSCALTLGPVIAPCVSLAPLRALAFDCCPDRLFLSDGRQTIALNVTGGTCPTLANQVGCCFLNHPMGQIWFGFDVPRRQGRPLGTACTGAPCPSCPTMTLDTFGDPVVGNLSFRLRVQNAPTGGNAFMFVSPGCMSPGLPFFCGQINLQIVGPFPFLIGSTTLPGVGTCGGNGVVPLPIPSNYSLCNVALCAQAVITCPPPGIGFGLTPAYSFVVQ